MKLNRTSTALFLLLIVIISSCNDRPEEINYNNDECEFCKMLITDDRYGSELIAGAGNIFKFDAVECMIEYALVKNLIGDESQKFLITDFAAPGTFINAEEAFYVRSDNFRSPMGLNVVAFDSEISRQKFAAENGGQLLNWSDVIVLVK